MATAFVSHRSNLPMTLTCHCTKFGSTAEISSPRQIFD